MSSACVVCRIAAERGITVDGSRKKTEWAETLGVGEATVRRHLKHGIMSSESGESESHGPTGSSYVRFSQTAWGFEDYRDFIRTTGQDPDLVTFTWGWTSNPTGGFWNKLNNVRPIIADADTSGPAWPVIQPAAPVLVSVPHVSSDPVPRIGGWKLGIKCADPQIGFRQLPDGTYDPFHDETAMGVFVKVCAEYRPDKITILGDFLDLPSQGRFAQEAAFANTTQMAINRGHQFLAELRAVAPTAQIILIEGNHDLRMQRFIESNALAAFGLKQANAPESWPVMSLPFLLRTDDLGIEYVDAYPAATDWDNDLTRNIHGTRSNSKGSTMSQYIHELPHVNTWAGHTHRCEIVYRTVLGARGEPIESYAANPGVLCRTDGAVPSVKGATGVSGIPERIVEDWQSGFGFNWYTATESWPQVYRIRDGKTIINDRVISA